MAHIKFKFDILNAFCNEAFENLVLVKKKVKLLQMYYFYQIFMELNHMGCKDFQDIIKGLKKG